MVKAQLVHAKDGHSAEVASTSLGHFLVAVSPDKLYSSFRSATRTLAGTTAIVTPRSGEAIALTDIVVSGEKKAGTVTIQFADGVNTVVICAIPLVDAPANFSIPFMGRWAGWRGARIDMVTTADIAITITVGYTRIKSSNALSYAEWDAER